MDNSVQKIIKSLACFVVFSLSKSEIGENF